MASKKIYDNTSHFPTDSLPIPDFPADIHAVAIYNRFGERSQDSVYSDEVPMRPMRLFILEHPSWNYIDKYIDYGHNNSAFDRMLKDCHDKKIDLVITACASKLARDSVSVFDRIHMLQECSVGVYFMSENLYSLDENHAMVLSLLNALALEENYHKSYAIPQSQRFTEGEYKTADEIPSEKSE